MSRLSKLIGKPITIKLEDEEFDVYPLTMDDLPLLMATNSSDPELQGKSFKKILFKTLKRSVPDATELELNDISVKYFKEFSEAIMKANGLNEMIPVDKK